MAANAGRRGYCKYREQNARRVRRLYKLYILTCYTEAEYTGVFLLYRAGQLSAYQDPSDILRHTYL